MEGDKDAPSSRLPRASPPPMQDPRAPSLAASRAAEGAPADSPRSPPSAQLAGDPPGQWPGRWIDGRGPSARELVRRVLGSGRAIWEHRELLATSVRRELASRLSGTLLGRAWPLLHPALLFAVYYFIFTQLLSFRLPGLPPGQASALGVHMFLGVLVWTAFSDSLARATRAIAEQGHLIQRVAFPSDVLVLTVVGAGLCTLLFGVAAFVVATWVTPVWQPPGALLLWVPVLLVLQALFTSGLGLLCATLHVFLRDTQHVVALVTTVWMFLTPVFWVPSTELFPGIRPWLGLLEANPMQHLLQAWRAVLMSGEPAVCFPQTLPHALAAFALFAVATFAIGYGAFVLGERRFADEV
jgi:homopolymeric O-antigen transport system permease protein